MLNSKQLRAKAWDALKGRYWNAFAVSFVSGLILSVSASLSNIATSMAEIPSIVDESQIQADAILSLGAGVILGMALLMSLISLIVYTFVDGPMFVGVNKYFINNIEEKGKFNDMFTGFKTNYGNNVKVMFLVSIKTALWTLLFVIPGVIKAFEYAMVPYILADNPDMSSKDAFALTKKMMTGNKWRLFKLNFSFIGWMLLCVLTCGIGTFFMLPYIEAANAEFYNEIKANV